MAHSPTSYAVPLPDGRTVPVRIVYARPFAVTLTASRCLICDRANALSAP